MKDREKRIEDEGLGIEDRGSRIEVWGSRIEIRGSRFEDRGSSIEVRGSRIRAPEELFKDLDPQFRLNSLTQKTIAIDKGLDTMLLF